MCGVAGLLRFDGPPVTEAETRPLARALAHRGPDGEGVFARGPVGLAHRRLAILDLTPKADQPMASKDGRHALVYNGEIYNFRELRDELAARGDTFASTGDTEVVLAALRAWGPAAVEKFNGIFALALWDDRERTLFLARDRHGVKPMYYTATPGHFLFASELKAFYQHPSFAPRLDPAALIEYFTFQNLFTDKTLLAGVRVLPAGCTLNVSRDRRDPAPARYWDYRFGAATVPEREQTPARLKELFEQAVRRQMVSDVEVGCYLSGGLDSGSITAAAARERPGLKSFTIGFDLRSASGIELGFDERETAERMSYLFKTEQYEVVLKSGDMERAMRPVVWHLETPRVGQSYPNYYAAKLAGRFVKVVLSGTGGDELFGGYPWRYYRPAGPVDFEPYIDGYYKYWQRTVPNSVLKNLFRPLAGEFERVWTRDIFRGVFPREAPRLRTDEDFVNAALYLEAKTFLHGLLAVEDTLSMAHGLETRVPFLDNDLVDFAMGVSARLKVGAPPAVRLDENEPGIKTEKYFSIARDGKRLLREMMESIVPAEISGARKQGFSGPDASWFRGESLEFVRRELMRPDARLYDYLDRETTTALLNEHLEGKANHRLFIWSLLSFQTWLDLYLPR
ncbi:MAG: asparagine synthase (glutamine-hydrolyzing) [Elusimicrobia bacterium]|nr:asparagine synthase (glutamine-hydrolyzing) [Elusimicrobiota bacterium]